MDMGRKIFQVEATRGSHLSRQEHGCQVDWSILLEAFQFYLKQTKKTIHTNCSICQTNFVAKSYYLTFYTITTNMGTSSDKSLSEKCKSKETLMQIRC